MAAYHVSIREWVSSVFVWRYCRRSSSGFRLVYYFGLEVVWENAAKEKVAS
jgi:hypothetical protein